MKDRLMKHRIRRVRIAAAAVRAQQGSLDHAHGELVDVMCHAMAAGVPPEGVCEAAGLNVSQLFDALRSNIASRHTIFPAGTIGY